MGKLSLFLMLVCLVGVVERCSANNYYWQTYPQAQEYYAYPQLAPIWQPTDCEKEEESGESKEESKESKEESKEGSEEGSKSKEEEEGSKEEEGGSKEEKEGSKEEKEGSKEEKEESEEKKEKKKKNKETRYIFPPRSYSYAAPYQQIVYSAPSSYGYMPYGSSYTLQQPVTSYQYYSGPSGYSAPYMSRMVRNPVAKVVYSGPAASKVVAPAAQEYSVPAPWSYVKK